jgi:hypothetical protein
LELGTRPALKISFPYYNFNIKTTGPSSEKSYFFEKKFPTALAVGIVMRWVLFNATASPVAVSNAHYTPH